MIDAKQIPHEVAVALTDALNGRDTRSFPACCEAIAAALNAWPSADIEPFGWASKPDILMLPLPKEGE